MPAAFGCSAASLLCTAAVQWRLPERLAMLASMLSALSLSGVLEALSGGGATGLQELLYMLFGSMQSLAFDRLVCLQVHSAQRCPSKQQSQVPARPEVRGNACCTAWLSHLH